jgi:hypothetical protein
MAPVLKACPLGRCLSRGQHLKTLRGHHFTVINPTIAPASPERHKHAVASFQVAWMSGRPGEGGTYLCQFIADVPQLVCYYEEGM